MSGWQSVQERGIRRETEVDNREVANILQGMNGWRFLWVRNDYKFLVVFMSWQSLKRKNNWNKTVSFSLWQHLSGRSISYVLLSCGTVQGLSGLAQSFFFFPLQRVDGLAFEAFVIYSGVSRDSVPSIIHVLLFIHDLLKSTSTSVYPVLTTVPFTLHHFSQYLSSTCPWWHSTAAVHPISIWFKSRSQHGEQTTW